MVRLLFLCSLLWCTPVGAQLAEECTAGKLNHKLWAACQSRMLEIYAEEWQELPADFFPWLRNSKNLQLNALTAIAECGPQVALNLQRLREEDADSVIAHSALAVAFAAAFANSTDGTPHRFWVDQWLVTGRRTPTMAESFHDVLAHPQHMRFDLERMPWQVLAHLADSLTPLEERAWARERYQARPNLREVFADVPYTLEPNRTDQPYTLASFVECGGPCTHNVQYAGGVFDAFAIPSGWAGGPGHTYPYWYQPTENGIRLLHTNEIGNRNGRIRNPVAAEQLWEDELRLDLEGMNLNANAYQRVRLAVWAFEQVAEAEQAAASAILTAAVSENPLCRPLVAAVLRLTKRGVFRDRTVTQIWSKILDRWAEHPHLLIPVLEQLFPQAGAKPIPGDVGLLKQLHKDWRDANHNFAVPNIDVWRARSLQARGKKRLADAIWQQLAEQSLNAAPHRFAIAVEAMAQNKKAAPDSDQRAKFLRTWLEKCPSEASQSRMWLLQQIRPQLELLQRVDEADWLTYQELARIAKPDASAPKTHLIGGDGGGVFEQSSETDEVVGLRVTLQSYNGRDVISSVETIFQHEDGVRFAEAAGTRRHGQAELRAPDGWRICGIIACGSDRLDGLQLVLVPRKNAKSQVRLGRWLGSRYGEQRLLGRLDRQVIGVHGRAGADIDALGLLLH